MTAQQKISVEHANVWVALAAAQSEFSAPKKDAINPAFRSKYADLASVVEAVAPALSRHGIAFVHYVEARDLGAGPESCMVTALIHGASDTRMECPIPLILGKRDMQGFKSATTYAKRIGLESVTGVAPDDDDGNDAAKAAPPRQQAAPRGPSPDAIDSAKAALGNADTLERLRAIWSDIPKPVQAVPAVIEAKDKRKAEIEADLNQPTDRPMAEIVGDDLPY